MASGTIKNSMGLFGIGTSIPTNTDLNTVTTFGRYYCNDISGLTNIPTMQGSASFDLLVMPRASSSRCWQIMYLYNVTEDEMWIRAQSGTTTFHAWKKVTLS